MQPAFSSSERVLPVAVCRGLELLVTGDRDPVWPIDPSTRMALESIASVFHFRIEEVEARVFCEDPEDGPVVVALGAESAPIARLYAHLTRRTLITIDDVRNLPAPGGFEVLITRRPCLTSVLLDRLYPPWLEQAPGILYDDDPARLTRQILARSAAAAVGGDHDLLHVDVAPVLDFDRAQGDGWLRLGGGASSDEVARALSRGNSILNVLTHSDGLDAELGSGLVMCPMDAEWRQSDRGRQPTCKLTGQCYRLKSSLDDLTGSDRLLHPSSVATRAFIFNTCVGVLPEDNNHDPRLGLGVRLAGNPAIGAVLTSWRPSLCRPTNTLSLAKLLAEGMSVGEAVARHNAIQNSLASGHQLCLIGDPALRVSLALPGQRRASSPPALRADVEALAMPGRYQTSLLRACLTPADRPREGSTAPLDPEGVASALGLIKAYEQDLETGQHCEVVAGAAMRKSVVALLAARGRFCDLWIPKAVSSRMVELRPRCLTCSNSTAVYEFEFDNPLIEPRNLEICPKCGFVRDAPVRKELAIVVKGGLVHLTGELTEDAWAGALTMQYRWPLPTHVAPWPADEAGRPARRCELPDRLRPVPAWITLTLASGSRIVLASQTLRPPP